ncbi:hypothetical protein B5S25_01965 [Paenibacillus larvae subsp. pulvifaciens]|nr:hypothetical protein B5S25_01965 [Paenibacillus larvae subsp. pulvifaciens]
MFFMADMHQPYFVSILWLSPPLDFPFESRTEFFVVGWDFWQAGNRPHGFSLSIRDWMQKR